MGGRRGGWLVPRVRHKRSVTVDVGRYHGQQIDRGDDDQEEHSDANDDRWPDRSQTRYRDVDDDQQSDPCDQRTIGIADDRLNECIVVGAAVEEAPPANEARPHEDGGGFPLVSECRRRIFREWRQLSDAIAALSTNALKQSS